MGERKVGEIVLRDDNAKEHGIRPRWAKIWKIGPGVSSVTPGQWALVEHGRWSLTITVNDDNNNSFKFQMIDPNGILCVSDEKPEDVADVDLPN